MTNHTPDIPISPSTVEAARRAMDKLVANQSDVTPTEAVTTILAAALPHIREQIAHEIESHAKAWPSTSHDWQDGITAAARIARGERP